MDLADTYFLTCGFWEAVKKIRFSQDCIYPFYKLTMQSLSIMKEAYFYQKWWIHFCFSKILWCSFYHLLSCTHCRMSILCPRPEPSDLNCYKFKPCYSLIYSRTKTTGYSERSSKHILYLARSTMELYSGCKLWWKHKNE